MSSLDISGNVTLLYISKSDVISKNASTQDKMKQKIHYYNILEIELVYWENTANFITQVVRRDNHITYFINTILTKITGN